MERPPPWSPPEAWPLPLETRRTVVDAYREGDAPELFRIIDRHREALASWLPWAARDHGSEEASRGRLRELAREKGYAHPDDYHLGIFDRAGRKLLGGTGLHRIAPETATAEVGYWIRPDRQGEGLATEAVRALAGAAFADFGFRRLLIHCGAQNEPSRRVAEKLGFRTEAFTVRSMWLEGEGWSDEVRYACLAEEWDAVQERGPVPPPPASGETWRKAYAATEPAVAPYVAHLLGIEEAVLVEIRRRSAAAGLPQIAVGAFDGRHLEVIARAAAARKMVEIGTLGGYSAVCLGRALPPDGVLHTFEVEPAHARVAEESLRRAGLLDRVRIHVGRALDRLGAIEAEGPFDLLFLDADKERYPEYLAWAERHLRVGGTLLADNVFRKPRGRAAADVIHAFNERLAHSPRWRLTMLPIEDGLALAVKLR